MELYKINPFHSRVSLQTTEKRKNRKLVCQSADSESAYFTEE